jgi:hypothetical protein
MKRKATDENKKNLKKQKKAKMIYFTSNSYSRLYSGYYNNPKYSDFLIKVIFFIIKSLKIEMMK